MQAQPHTHTRTQHTHTHARTHAHTLAHTHMCTHTHTTDKGAHYLMGQQSENVQSSATRSHTVAETGNEC